MPPGRGLAAGTTKRVRCSVENEDEDEDAGISFRSRKDKKEKDGRGDKDRKDKDKKEKDRDRDRREDKKDKKARTKSPEKKSSGDGDSNKKKKKEKAFAWMDSDEEDEADDDEKEGDAKAADADSDGDANMELSIDVFEKAQSFGRMMILSTSLRRRLRDGSLDAEVTAAACRALGRNKFFDGDLQQDLSRHICKLLDHSKMDMMQTMDIIDCCKELNAYDRTVFSAVARAFKAQTSSMHPIMRQEWLRVFQAFGHEREKDFLQLLEVPHLQVNNPGFRKIRCAHHSRGKCHLEHLSLIQTCTPYVYTASIPSMACAPCRQGRRLMFRHRRTFLDAWSSAKRTKLV
eukprot:TRINITY_DN10899_c0_g2_i2.p1 TRINITY_DN10899_c0_g2~~TRINITY_DN10899_c0_g2_i2.p1  ORF type:complete len:346 (-),score=92.65 TRINITY_DN10899_c0_g2_i2:44-1081(-)